MKGSQTYPVFARATRSLAPEGAYAVLAKAQELERKGKSIIHLEIGQPDFPTPDYIVHAAISALKAGKTKYTPPLGILPLRNQIAKGVSKTHGVPVDAMNVAITPSAKAAIFAVMMLILEKGDEVIYPDPGFPTYRTLIDFFGAVPKPVRLTEQSGFSLDMDHFARSVTKKTKLVILNSPSNPTGGIIPIKDLVTISKILRKTKAFVLSDEIYRDIIYGNIPVASVLSIQGMKERTVLVNGFSKTFSMTGWRLGYIVVPDRLTSTLDFLLTHMVGCTSSFIQEAGLVALTSKTSVGMMVREFRKRRDYLVTALNKIPGIKCQEPQGAFYVFPNVSSFGRSSKDIANTLLIKAGVAVLDGTSFGAGGEGYIRLSYATSMKDLREAIERIRDCVKQW